MLSLSKIIILLIEDSIMFFRKELLDFCKFNLSFSIKYNSVVFCLETIKNILLSIFILLITCSILSLIGNLI